MAWLQTISLIVLICGVAGSPKVPKYPKSYSTEGVLKLPYTEIIEPFAFTVNFDEKISVTDYYHGTSLMIHDGPNGATFTINYVTDESEMNKKKCVGVRGLGNAMQTIPKLDNFTFEKTEKVDVGSGPIKCNKFVYSHTVTGKLNRYIFWAAQSDNRPVRYEMFGFGSLFGSHFDKYIIDYHKYTTRHFSRKRFDKLMKKYKCGESEKIDIKSDIEVNPFREIIDGETGHVDSAFDEFKNKHDKKYDDEKSEIDRKQVFRHNLRYIHSMNRAGKSFRLAVNHLADRTKEELVTLFGYRPTKDKSMMRNHTEEEIFGEWKDKELPDSLDYRQLGAVTPVKDQSMCGSCWSFGTVGALEGAYALKHGKRLTFAEQELVDCSWGFNNAGCYGGDVAFEYIKKHGLATNFDYGIGTYLGANGKCVRDEAKRSVRVKDFGGVPTSTDGMKRTLLSKGPIAVGINAAVWSFSFYSSGVYHDPHCNDDRIDHLVTAVGYGKMNGREYFIIKNSWSSYWGMDGYILLGAKGDTCHVEEDATWVEVE